MSLPGIPSQSLCSNQWFNLKNKQFLCGCVSNYCYYQLQILDLKVHLLHKLDALLDMRFDLHVEYVELPIKFKHWARCFKLCRQEGVDTGHLQLCNESIESDFEGGDTDKYCGFTWRSLFPGKIKRVTLPLKLAPCQVNLSSNSSWHLLWNMFDFGSYL